MFVVYAHRGASEYAPENTMSAFRLGLELQANGIETDVQRTKDGVLVLFHDDSLERVTGQSGAIRDYTYEQLLRLDVKKGSLHDKIVKFEDFLREFSLLDITFAIELKVDDTEKEVIDLLRRYQMQEKTVITSFGLERIKAAKRYAPEFRTGYLTASVTEELERLLIQIGVEELCPYAELITKENVKRWHELGFSVRAWGVKDECLMKQVYNNGADGTTVNFPDKLIAYIKNRRSE